MWLPGTAAAMPAIIASRVASISVCDGLAAGSPTKNVRAAVAMPAVDDRAGIDRDDLALADRALAGDPVDDLVIERDAQAGRGTAGAD